MDGLDVYRLGTGPEAAATLDRIGGRTAPPLERSLSMEKQGDFVIAGSLLYKPMGRFGLLVFDVSDPARPRRVYHATQQDGYWFGRWGGAWCLVDPAHSWGGATLVEAGKRAGDGR